MQGCPFHCYNCFNPKTWDFNGGKEWTEEIEKQFMEMANRPYIKRVSILGGEPLANENLQNVLNLVNKIRLLLPEKTIWLYTGYTWEAIMDDAKRREIVLNCDVLIDGQYIDEQRDITLKWRGSPNQRVIDVKQSIADNQLKLHTE